MSKLGALGKSILDSQARNIEFRVNDAFRSFLEELRAEITTSGEGLRVQDSIKVCVEKGSCLNR